jgi:hypothetical protein
LRNGVAFVVDVARALQHASLLAVESHGSLELVRMGLPVSRTGASRPERG